MLADYQNDTTRALAGYITGKEDSELESEEIESAEGIIDQLSMPDYMDLTFALTDRNEAKIDKVLAVYDVELDVSESNKMPTVKPRQPKGMFTRKSGAGAHDNKKDKRDRWSRTAKHKKPNLEETSEDEAMKDQKDSINESVIGMSNVPSLSRMKKLAGIHENTDKVDEDQFVTKMPELDADMDAVEYDSDIDSDYDADYDTDSDLDPLPVGPVDLPAPVEGALHSEAYAEIMDALQTVQLKLSDVKMSEYKELLNKLKDVHQTIRDMGFSYLQESKYTKKK